MKRNREIILSSKSPGRRRLGFLGRRVRLIAALVAVVSFVSWSVNWMSTQRRIRQAQVDISRITHAVRLFRVDFERCPVNLEELRKPPEGTPYLEDTTDPWGHQYVLVCPSGRSADDVNVISRGPDGMNSSNDNIQRVVLDTNR